MLKQSTVLQTKFKKLLKITCINQDSDLNLEATQWEN